MKFKNITESKTKSHLSFFSCSGMKGIPPSEWFFTVKRSLIQSKANVMKMYKRCAAQTTTC